tara:strand:- start:387 stop:635 length:249 start_codon:yes stop_codon:yes gene_type:complete
MKKVVCLFISSQNISKVLYIYDDFIKNVIKNFGNFTVVNFFELENKKLYFIKDLEVNLNNKVKFFTPKSNSMNFVKVKKYLH